MLFCLLIMTLYSKYSTWMYNLYEETSKMFYTCNSITLSIEVSYKEKNC